MAKNRNYGSASLFMKTVASVRFADDGETVLCLVPPSLAVLGCTAIDSVSLLSRGAGARGSATVQPAIYYQTVCFEIQAMAAVTQIYSVVFLAVFSVYLQTDLKGYVRRGVLRTWHEQWVSTPAQNKLRSIRDGVSRCPSSIRKSRREEVIVTRLRVGHTSLTHGFLLRGDPPPVCGFCDAPLSVYHILVECRKLAPIRLALDFKGDMLYLFDTLAESVARLLVVSKVMVSIRGTAGIAIIGEIKISENVPCPQWPTNQPNEELFSGDHETWGQL
uniref:Uncharacterized protein n=1 Tax=Timema shepardi TaxID=629360 RepID=A0A7R9G1K2_TIMSH|nr:unnamed protein product [Timema shepardi]